jgi:2'-5' RNA ligase
MKTLRSFVAVPLPGEVQADVFAAAQALARELPAVKWSRKVENLHVTIKFLGQVTEERLDALAAMLVEALRPVPPFRIVVRGMGAFPSARKANVLWAGVQDGAGDDASDHRGGESGHGERRLTAAAEVVEAVTARLGFSREQRLFRAHVTVGRCPKGVGVDARGALGPFAGRLFGAVTVDEVHLYESRLGKDGSTYVLRSRAPLGPSDSN